MLVKSCFKLPDPSLSSGIIHIRKRIGSLKLNSCPWNLSCWNAQDFASSVLGLHSSSAFSLGSSFPQQTFQKVKLNYSADREPSSIYSHLLEILASVTNPNMCLDSFFAWKCCYSHPENTGVISANKIVLSSFFHCHITNLPWKFCSCRLEREALPKTLYNI